MPPLPPKAVLRPVKTFRLIAGCALVLVGVPLYVLPIPLGLLFLLPGLYLLMDASPWLRRRWCGLPSSCRRCAELLSNALGRRQGCSGQSEAVPVPEKAEQHRKAPATLR
jgi:hypothetical protein